MAGWLREVGWASDQVMTKVLSLEYLFGLKAIWRTLETSHSYTRRQCLDRGSPISGFPSRSHDVTGC